jgi:hypothetical protein
VEIDSQLISGVEVLAWNAGDQEKALALCGTELAHVCTLRAQLVDKKEPSLSMCH